MQEFFKAAEEGSIERLEELFDTIDTADPNMTQVGEKERKKNDIFYRQIHSSTPNHF